MDEKSTPSISLHASDKQDNQGHKLYVQYPIVVNPNKLATQLMESKQIEEMNRWEMAHKCMWLPALIATSSPEHPATGGNN